MTEWTVFVFIVWMLTNVLSAKPLHVVADEWPPFSGKNLPHHGLSPHIIKTALERAGYEVEVTIVPWARIINGAKKEKYDVVGSLFFAQDLQPYLTYSEPYFTTDIQFVRAKETAATFDSLESLKGYRIAVGDGFLYEDNFDQAEDLNKVVATTTLQCLKMVAYGRADLTLDSVEVIDYSLRTDAPELLDKLEYLPRVLTQQKMYMAVTKSVENQTALLDAFNESLKSMEEDGTLGKILEIHKVKK